MPQPESACRPRAVPSRAGIALLIPLVVLSVSADSDPSRNRKPAAVLPTTVDALAWVVGCWARTDAEKGSGEDWTRSGDRLVGRGRTVVGGRVAETETLEIRSDERGLLLEARPNGQPPTIFRLIEARTDRMVFENPFHDFPQRIVYERSGERLDARIEGTLAGGKRKSMSFPMTATRCR